MNTIQWVGDNLGLSPNAPASIKLRFEDGLFADVSLAKIVEIRADLSASALRRIFEWAQEARGRECLHPDDVAALSHLLLH